MIISLGKRRQQAYLDRQFEDLLAHVWPEGVCPTMRESLQAAFEAGYGLSQLDSKQGRIKRWLKP